MAEDIVVTRIVEAPPERVWDLVGDPTRIGAISPECHRVDWLGGPRPALRLRSGSERPPARRRH